MRDIFCHSSKARWDPPGIFSPGSGIVSIVLCPRRVVCSQLPGEAEVAGHIIKPPVFWGDYAWPYSFVGQLSGLILPFFPLSGQNLWA